MGDAVTKAIFRDCEHCDLNKATRVAFSANRQWEPLWLCYPCMLNERDKTDAVYALPDLTDDRYVEDVLIAMLQVADEIVITKEGIGILRLTAKSDGHTLVTYKGGDFHRLLITIEHNFPYLTRNHVRHHGLLRVVY